MRLYSPAQSAAMYPFSEGLTTNSSQVDLAGGAATAREHRRRFPLFRLAPFCDCVLEPGQALYVPPGWWHCVQSLDVSFSVNFFWR